MAEFVAGQRWVVDAEPELGLGIVMAVDARVVTLAFPQAECERMYARQKAPLTRIIFEVGDDIHTADGKSGTVVAAHEHAGLKFYDIGQEQLVPEVGLASEIKMNQPLLRLQTGQLDAAKWFAFRRQLDGAMARTWQSQLGGLLGVRANLIPHQLYVAHSACNRENVRVLLADEVGLGKTLEAGMILSRLLRFERAQRVLLLVPDALQIQWLVELIRRFNLRPDLYAAEEHDFTIGQIHLVPHSAMHTDARLRESLAEFDMAIVDEAHHIQPGSQAFVLLSTIAANAKHLVLLSATPEQLGVESHFARLQLLDPAKFDSLKNFMAQEQAYGALNQQIRALPKSRDELVHAYDLDPSLSDEQLVDQLLDCHGIGRVMFRNTRASVAGFPERIAVPHLLDQDSWEAKFEWLAGFVRQNSGKKILVICHAVENVRDCEAHLWQKHGIHVALFHEDMDLIERDSAAAYFADMERGCQLLLCSEIGSEGRNFQFSHHLVCLDLPDHPDMLEQRIGRLDRIGQTQKVSVHIPYCEGSGDWEKFVWYHHVLQCIDRQSPAAGAVHDLFWSQLTHTSDDLPVHKQAHQKLMELEKQIQQGRDALLEMNSCRQPQASELVKAIAEFEGDTPLALVEQASELLNFYFEETQGGAYSLIPADNMLIAALPGIPLDGVEVTFDRALANAREDVLFLTWDSPFITGLWEILHHSDLGSASVALLPSKQLPPGQCLLETGFDLLIQSSQATACLPFLTDLSVRVLVLDGGNKDLSDVLPEISFEKSLTQVDKKLARKIIQSRKDVLPQWYAKAEKFAEVKREQLLNQAMQRVRTYFTTETQRLENLARRNPQVSPQEVDALRAKEQAIIHALQNQVQVQLSAIRLVVTTEL
jgi:ATP-dependent helicase HepA